jgi:uncharacterized membrane protein
MSSLKTLSALMPWQDWAALFWFCCAWVGYAWFARVKSQDSQSLLVLTNRERRNWMLTSTSRENRIIDGSIVQTLTASPSFFASTTILIIGGLIATLGTSEKANLFVREIPFAANTSNTVFDLKLVVLLGIFIYAFFRFTWSQRVYSFGALLVGAAPAHDQFTDESHRLAYADRAGKLMALAAETFNDGLRAYFMAFAVIAWLTSPLAFAIATAAVVWALYRREFKSDVLAILAKDTNLPL